MKKCFNNKYRVRIFNFFSCAPCCSVKPLEKGKYAAGINLGGPLFDFSGMTIPIPFSSIGGGYGLTKNTTIYSNLHTTSLLFKVYMIDAGIKQSIITKRISTSNKHFSCS